MTVAGIILIGIIICRLMTCFDYEKNLFFFFELTILINIFINIGYVFSFAKSLSLGEIMMIFCMIYGFYGRKKITGKSVLAIIIIAICVLIGNINIYYNSSQAKIVSWDNTNIDYVLYGFESAVNPVFGKSNVNAMLWMLIFVMFCFTCSRYFLEEQYVKNLYDFLLKAFHVMCLLLLVEMIVSNISKGVWARNLINTVFGVTNDAISVNKVYSVAPKRYGVYCIYGFYSEPSYMTSFLIYACLLTRMKKISKKESMYVILSVLCLLFTGSSAAYMVIPFILGIVLYKNVFFNLNRFQKMVLMSVIIVFIMLAIYIIIDNYSISGSKESILDKIAVYIKGSNSSINSGYTRKNGNQLCYGVLKYNPLFGVGLGTTRGYGFIPGAVACLGIIGILGLFNFYIQVFNVDFSKHKYILLIILLYLTSCFSVWYIYSPFMIGLFIAFNRGLKESIQK